MERDKIRAYIDKAT